MKKKLIYEVFRHTDVELNLMRIADIYSDGNVVSRLLDDEASRIAREIHAGNDSSKLKQLEKRDLKLREAHQNSLIDILNKRMWSRIQGSWYSWEEFLSYNEYNKPTVSIAEKMEIYKPWVRSICGHGSDWYVNPRYNAACWALQNLGYASQRCLERGSYTEVPYYKEIPPYRKIVEDMNAEERRYDPLLENATWAEFVTKYHGEGAAWEYNKDVAKYIEKLLALSGGEPVCYDKIS